MKNIKTSISILLSMASFCFISKETLAASIIVPPIVDTQLKFGGEVHGSDFDTTETHTRTGGASDKWSWNYIIKEDAGYLNDVLTVSGSLKHLEPPSENPHGEGPNNEAFDYKWVLDADKFRTGDNNAADIVKDLRHVDHWDSFKATLDFTTTGTLYADDITSYTLKVTGVHSTSSIPPPIQIPRKSTSVPDTLGFATFASTILSLFTIAPLRRRLTSTSSETQAL